MKIYNWHVLEKISVTDIAENKIVEVNVAGKRIGLLKRNNEVYAFTASCPHAGVNLCNGWIDGMGRIVCPEHKYRFDPASGRNTSGEGYKLYTYPVEVSGTQISIGVLVVD